MLLCVTHIDRSERVRNTLRATRLSWLVVAASIGVACGDDTQQKEADKVVGSMCRASATCGGDPVGSWEVVPCARVEPPPARHGVAGCPDAFVTFRSPDSVDAGLSLTPDGRYQMFSRTHASTLYSYPLSCVGGKEGCAVYGQALESLVSAEAGFTGPGITASFAETQCLIGSSGRCECNLVSDVRYVENGDSDVEQANLTLAPDLTPGMSPEVAAPRHTTFCVSELTGTLSAQGSTMALARAAGDELGHYQVAANAIALDGDLAYVAAGSRFHIIDISDPRAPVERGQALGAFGVIADVFVRGPFVIAVAYEGIEVYDVRDPAKPQVAATWDPGAFVSRSTAEGNHLFVGTDAGVQVFDLAALPVLTPAGKAAPDLLVRTRGAASAPGKVAFIDNGGDLHVLAAAPPFAPLDEVPIAHDVVAATFEGDVLVMLSGTGGLRTLDLSRGVEPVIHDAFPASNLGVGLTVSGSRAFLIVGNAAGVLEVVVVELPTHTDTEAKELHRWAAQGALTLAVHEGYAYVSDGGWFKVVAAGR